MNFIIGIIIIFYLIWVWNSTKDFETIVMRVSYIFVGTLFMIVFCLILFQISKIGVNYPKEEMVGQVRRIILLVFVPLNGLVILTQVSTIITQIKSGMISKEDMNKKIKIRSILLVALIVVECIYFKNIQYGILKIMNSRLS